MSDVVDKAVSFQPGHIRARIVAIRSAAQTIE